MSFKPESIPSPLPHLHGVQVLALAGRDAEAFAQAQFSTDVKQLTPGRWHWSTWLTAKGRVVAIFALVRLDAERFWLVLPDFPADALAERLQRYVFRSKLTLTPCPGIQAAALALPSPTPMPSAWQGDPERALLLDFSGEGEARGLVLWADPPEGALVIDPAAAGHWRLADLRHGLPRLPPEQVEAWTPHMLSLDRLGAVSVKKGCYPGQEIVARTHFLGQAKRGLARLATTAGAATGQAPDIRSADGQVLGRSVFSAAADTGCEVLAVLPTELPAEPLLAEDVEARILPLLGGLSRQA